MGNPACYQFSLNNVPELDLLIGTAAGEKPAVRAERDCSYRFCVSFQPAEMPAVRRMPESDPLVVACRGERGAVRTVTDRGDRTLVPGEHPRVCPLQIPELERSRVVAVFVVVAPGKDLCPRGEGDGPSLSA